MALPRPVNGTSIFVAEMAAAVWGITSIRRDVQQKILCDNAAVVQALRRGHSTNKKANGILQKVVTTAGWRIGWIPSADNRADGPSRGTAIAPIAFPEAIKEVERPRWSPLGKEGGGRFRWSQASAE